MHHAWCYILKYWAIQRSCYTWSGNGRLQTDCRGELQTDWDLNLRICATSSYVRNDIGIAGGGHIVQLLWRTDRDVSEKTLHQSERPGLLLQVTSAPRKLSNLLNREERLVIPPDKLATLSHIVWFCRVATCQLS